MRSRITRSLLTSLSEGIGIVLVVIGIGSVSIPAGIVVAGAALIALGVLNS
jgi:hypothetical protein